MKASVVIPAWNGREYLPGCLDSLLAQSDPDFEVIVVDNASTDGSADLVAEKYPQVRLIRSVQNLGFAGGCNVGLRAARGEILVLLNQDTIVRPGWLQGLVEMLQKPEIGVVGCKLLYPDGRTIQHAGGWIEWPLCLSHHYGQGEEDKGQFDESRPVDYVTGAAMAFRRDVIERIGLLDEGFWPAYYEDVDLCYRAREAGYEVWYIPNSIAIHYEKASIQNLERHLWAWNRSRLRLALKYISPDRFLTEFTPAETTFMKRLTASEGPGPLSAAYLIALMQAPSLLQQRWKVDPLTQRLVLNALAMLYRECWNTGIGEITSPEVLRKKIILPPLREFQFRSRVPVLGPLIAQFRAFVYSLASRWAIRDLIAQQEAIHRMIEANFGEIYRQMGWMVEQVVGSLLEFSLTQLESNDLGGENGCRKGGQGRFD